MPYADSTSCPVVEFRVENNSLLVSNTSNETILLEFLNSKDAGITNSEVTPGNHALSLTEGDYFVSGYLEGSQDPLFIETIHLKELSAPKLELTLIPNPIFAGKITSARILSSTMGIGDLKVFDSRGILMFSSAVELDDSGTIDIPLTFQQTGIYQIHFTKENQVLNTKVVVIN